MMKKEITILLVIVLIGGLFIFYRSGSIGQKILEQPISAKLNWESKTNEEGSVVVTITPIDILSPSKEWKFDIAMNTHSIELQNPIETVIIIDNQGQEYKPINWNGPTEGHHMNGTLTFNQVSPIPNSIELKISNIDDVEKNFIWELK